MEQSPLGEEGVLSPSDSASSDPDPHHDGKRTANLSDDSSVSSAIAIKATPGETIHPNRHKRRRTHLHEYHVRRIPRKHSSRSPHLINSSECANVGEDNHKCSRRPRPSTPRPPIGTTTVPDLTTTDFCYDGGTDITQTSEGQAWRTSCTETFRGTWCNHCSGNRNSITQTIQDPQSNHIHQCCCSFIHCPDGSQYQTPGCPEHSHICYAGHDWQCDFQTDQIAANHSKAFWGSSGVQRSSSSVCLMELCVGTPRQSLSSNWLPDSYCGQRLRRGGPIAPSLSYSTLCRKKLPHGSCYDCPNCCTSQLAHVRSVRAFKAPKRPKEQRVKARRIRHPPCDDSNSESEQNGPVIDVRAMGPAASRLSSASFPLGQQRQLSNSRTFQAITSAIPSTESGPNKVFSCPGLFQIQISNGSIPASSDIYVNENRSSSVPRITTVSPPHSSSSSLIDELRTNSSSYTCSYTESSSSSNLTQHASQRDVIAHHPYIYSCPVDPAASTSHSCNHHAPLGHPYCISHPNSQFAMSSCATGGSGMAVSSGDFLNVRRAWTRSRTQPNKCGRRHDIAYYALRMTRDMDNYAGREPHRPDWRCLSQAFNPAGHCPCDSTN